MATHSYPRAREHEYHHVNILRAAAYSANSLENAARVMHLHKEAKRPFHIDMARWLIAAAARSRLPEHNGGAALDQALKVFHSLVDRGVKPRT